VPEQRLNPKITVEKTALLNPSAAVLTYKEFKTAENAEDTRVIR
jgi:hypothetical protein